MYNEQLEEKHLPIDAIYLDPNNPRFWSEKSGRDVPDQKVSDDAVQEAALQQIQKFGVEELLNSVLRNGFLPLDRIVVRPLAHNKSQFVVVEGNRRLSALKTLRRRIADEALAEPNISDEYLAALKAATNTISVLVYNGAEGEEIAWMLQGIRHIGGVREWSPAQQGKLVADQIDGEGLKFREVGQRLGLSAQQVGKRYRAYKALEQMRKDEEFRDRAENRYYSLFEEAVGSREMKQWLGWSDDDFSFHNTDALKQFYSWIIPDDEDEEKRRRIHDPRHIKKLGFLTAGNHASLLSQIDSHDVSLESAFEKAKGAGPSHNWREAVDSAKLLLEDIPQSAIAAEPDDVLSRLEQLIVIISGIQKMATAVRGAQSPQI